MLGAIPYQRNEAVLHTDSTLLPRRRAARAAWNFHLLREPKPLSTVTYYMNHLQRLRADRDFCVTLNRTEAIDPAKIIRTIAYAHPVYTPAGVAAQAAACDDRRPGAPHPLLRRLLGLGLSRGRRRQRAARLRAVRGEPVSLAAARTPRVQARSSCLYEGSVRHRRTGRGARRVALPAVHGLPRPRRAARSCFDGRWLWSARRPALAWFRRADYLGDPAIPLADAVRALVRERTGTRPEGPIRLLTHLRYFGHCFNPVSFYYCFDAACRAASQAVVAEVTNTPWGERHAYVMDVDRPRRSRQCRS